MKKNLTDNSEKGLALLNVLGVVAFVGIVAAVMVDGVNTLFKVQQGLVFHPSSVALITEQVISLVEQNGVWAQTVASDLNLSCLRTNGVVCPAGRRPIQLYLPGGQLYLSQGGTDGFDKNGFRCTSYKAAQGDGLCIYKARVSWEPVCAGGPSCTSVRGPGDWFAKSPGQRIYVDVSFRSSNVQTTAEINVLKAAFVFVRGMQDRMVKTFCSAIPGELVGGGMHCILKIQPQDCGQRNMVDYVSTDGVIHCARHPLFGDGTNVHKCTGGNAIAGIAYGGGGIECDVF